MPGHHDLPKPMPHDSLLMQGKPKEFISSQETRHCRNAGLLKLLVLVLRTTLLKKYCCSATNLQFLGEQSCKWDWIPSELIRKAQSRKGRQEKPLLEEYRTTRRVAGDSLRCYDTLAPSVKITNGDNSCDAATNASVLYDKCHVCRCQKHNHSQGPYQPYRGPGH